MAQRRKRKGANHRARIADRPQPSSTPHLLQDAERRNKAPSPRFGNRIHILLIAVGFLLILAGWMLAPEFHRILPSRQFRKEADLISGHLRWLGIATGTALIGLSVLACRSEAIRIRLVKIALPAVLVMTSVMLSLATVEVALYAMFKDIQVGGSITPAHYTFYRTYYRDQKNNLGFRDKDRDIRKKEGQYRLLALGDSYTFGSGVKRIDDIYTSILERELNEKHADENRSYEVINTGVNGLNTAQELNWLSQKGKNLRPDFIILGYVLNDADSPEIKRAVSNVQRERQLLPYPYGRFLYGYSFTYYLVQKGWQNIVPGSQMVGDKPFTLENYTHWLYSGERLATHKAALESLLTYCTARSLPILVVIFPRLYAIQSGEPYPFTDVHQWVRETVEHHGIPVLDLYDAVSSSDLDSFTVSPWDGHPNEGVHRIAAESIYSRIISDDLIPVMGN